MQAGSYTEIKAPACSQLLDDPDFVCPILETSLSKLKIIAKDESESFVSFNKETLGKKWTELENLDWEKKL